MRREYKELDAYYNQKKSNVDHLLLMLEKSGVFIFLMYVPFWLFFKGFGFLFRWINRRFKKR